VPTGTRTDPYRGYNFLVEIDGITQAGFQEVSGLDASTDAIEYREGNDPNHVRKLPGLNKYSAISLKRGITDSGELWK
jgi:phage tail-like protein